MKKIDFIRHVSTTGDWNTEILELYLKSIEGDELKIKTDSRKVDRGDVFLALEGEKVDAHDFVNHAFRMGACFCIVSKLGKYDGACLFVDDPAEFVQKIASSYFLENKPRTLAISGSNGKTTTKEWTRTILQSVLKGKKRIFANHGNMNTEIGLPVSIINEFRPDTDYALLEMGMSRIGDLKQLCALFKPDYGMLTNIGSAHIGNVGSYDEILAGKRELTDSIGKDGAVILNISDYKLSRIAGEYSCKVLKYGFKETAADFSVRNYTYRTDSEMFETSVEIDAGEAVIHAKLDFLAHKGQISDFAGALTAASLFAEKKEICEAEFEGIKPVSQRFKFERINDNWLVSDYYNSSVESCESALSMLYEIRNAGIIKSFSFVVGSIAETGAHKESVYDKLCLLVEKYRPDALFLYSRNEEIKYLREKFPNAYESCDKHELSKKIKKHLLEVKGQAVLFKASRSVEMEDVYEIVVDFSD